MRRFAYILLLALVPLSARAVFPDTAGSRYGEQIQAAAKLGVLRGYPDGTFRPLQVVNRAELLKVALWSASPPDPPRRRCFPDVPTEAWYAPFVCTAKQRGIIQGYPDGSFQPEKPVNFAEALVILLRAHRAPLESASSGAWFAPAIDFAHEQEIVSRHSFLPTTLLTRERLAQLLVGIEEWEHPPLGEPHGFLSDGCETRPPDSLPREVSVNGQVRPFLLDLPENYSPRNPVSLIIAFHGRTNSNEQVRDYMGLKREATDFIVAYPAAIQKNGSYSWSNPGDRADSLRDYAFFDTLVQVLSDSYCIDLDRVHVAGHSLGAWFANSLACARGDVIRGSVTLGGSVSAGKTCAGPVAAMVLHHPQDNLAPFSGGLQARDVHLAQNGCTAAPESPTSPRDFLCVRHTSCEADRPVVWCPHELSNGWNGGYYPHQWPRETGEHAAEFLRQLE